MHPNPNRFRSLAAALLLVQAAIFPFSAPAAPKPKASPQAPSAKKIAPADDISAPPRSSIRPSAAAASSQAAPADAGSDRVLWDYWYTVTINKTLHYEYYNDRAEIKKRRVVFQNRAWKKEEGYINEEQVGAFAEATPELTPLFFNFHSTYRSTETSIDGNVGEMANAKGGKELTVRIRKGDAELPLIKRSIGARTFFSELFPVWLGFRLKDLRPGQTIGFQTILEDNVDAGFMPVPGQVRLEPSDDFAKKNGVARLAVDYQDMKSTWWVEASGAPIRIEMPLQRTVVERVSKEKAEAFLKPGS